jgi:dTDP-4-amino-4,6-dideoxygalactose transaminase
LCVVEDAAQAIGARFGGRKLGNHGLLGCFSFYPSKNLGAVGEGGLVTTNDPALATRIRALRQHAQSERYLHSELGFNYRMEGIQGLILGLKLPHLDEWTDERRRIARRYIEGLAGTNIQRPSVTTGDHIWYSFVIHTSLRDRLRAALAEQNIDTGMHYPVPLHRQPCFSHLPVDPAGYPIAERNARQCLSLPLYVGMTDTEIDRVIDAVCRFFRIT